MMNLEAETVRILAFVGALLLIAIGPRLLKGCVGVGLALSLGALMACLLDACLGPEWGDENRVEGLTLIGLAAVAGFALSRIRILVRGIEAILGLVAAWEIAPFLTDLAGSTAGGIAAIFLAISAMLSRWAFVSLLAGLVLVVALQFSSLFLSGACVFICLLIGYLRWGKVSSPAIHLFRKRKESEFGIRSLAKSCSDEVKVITVFDSEEQLNGFANRNPDSAIIEYSGLSGFASVKMTRGKAFMLQRFPDFVRIGSPATTPGIVALADAPVRGVFRDPLQPSAMNAEMSMTELQRRLLVDKGGSRIEGDGARGEGVRVAILDTGGEIRPEYSDRIVERLSFVSHEPSFDDYSESKHGSNCGMIVNALAPRASLLFYKVLDRNGVGTLESIMDAFSHIATEGQIDVVNASFGSCCCSGAGCVMCRAVEKLEKVVFCAAAGNGGEAGVDCPGNAQAALAVAACTSDGEIAPFSGRGRGISKPDLTAYGCSILLRTTCKGDNTEPMNGTSFACPQVAASAAIALAASNSMGISLPVEKVKDVMMETADLESIKPRYRRHRDSGRGLIDSSAMYHRVVGSKSREKNFQKVSVTSDLLAAWIVRLLCICGITTSWMLLDSASEIHTSKKGSSHWMIGRIENLASGEFALEDGRGKVKIRWRGEDQLMNAGSIALIAGEWMPNEEILFVSRRVGISRL